MSQENVEVVRRFVEAMERLLEGWDTSRSVVEAMKADDIPPEAREALGYMTAEAEWSPVFSGETYRGQLELGRAMDELLQAAGTYSVELRDLTDLENDRVFVVYGLALRGRTSGIQVGVAMFSVVTVKDGSLLGWSRSPARSPPAVGLSEKTLTPTLSRRDTARAMSQENVEVVRSMFAAYRAGEVEAVIDAADPDIELRPGLVGGLEGTVYRGWEGFRAFLEDVDAAWELFRIELTNSGTWAKRSWCSGASEHAPETE